jgi:hypothetical protein
LLVQQHSTNISIAHQILTQTKKKIVSNPTNEDEVDAAAPIKYRRKPAKLRPTPFYPILVSTFENKFSYAAVQLAWKDNTCAGLARVCLKSTHINSSPTR